MNDFMKDRYGVDELTCVLGGAGMLLALIGTIANLDPLTWIALAIVLLALARAFSKNITVRCNENTAFGSFSERVPVLGNLVARLGSITPAGRNASGGSTAPPLLTSSTSARSAPPRRCGRSARPRASSSAPTAGRSCPCPRARASSA